MTFDAWFSSTSLVLIRISRLNSAFFVVWNGVYMCSCCQHQKSFTMFPQRSIFALLKLPFKKVVSRKRKLYIGLNSLCWPTNALQKSKCHFKCFPSRIFNFDGFVYFFNKAKCAGKIGGKFKMLLQRLIGDFPHSTIATLKHF